MLKNPVFNIKLKFLLNNFFLSLMKTFSEAVLCQIIFKIGALKNFAIF